MLLWKKVDNSSKKRRKPLKIIIYTLFFSAIIFISAIMQTTFLEFFGKSADITLAIVCAIGFIAGEKAGCISGLFSGILISYLGGSGLSFAPIIYVLCGYFCGALVGWFLSQNFPSFILYSLVAGVIKEIFTIIYFGLFSDSFDIWQIFIKITVPEFFAYSLCVIPAYGIILSIFTLFKGKDEREKRRA